MAITQQYDTLLCLEDLLYHLRLLCANTSASSAPLSELDTSLTKISEAWKKVQATVPTILTSLLAERNKLAPVSKIPLEILFRIFHFANEDCATVFAISHTCVFWRNAIINFPAAWTNIDMTSLPVGVATLFAARSKQRSLFVSDIWRRYMQPDGNTTRRIEFWQKEAHRMKSIALAVRADAPTTCIDIIRSATDIPAPSLETLTLTQRIHHGMPHADVFPLQTLFAQETPNLHSVSLVNVRLPWTSPLYRGLSHLSIRMSVDDWIGQSEDNSILNVFQNSPQLEEIEVSIAAMHRGLGRYFNDGEEARPLTYLLNARKVYLEMDPYDMAVILSSIVLPPHLDTLVLKPTVTGLLAKVLPDNTQCLACLGNITSILVDFQVGEIYARTPPPKTEDGSMALQLHNITLVQGAATFGGAFIRFDAYIDVLMKINLVNSLDSLTEITVKGLLGPWLSPAVISQLLQCAPSLQRLVLDGCPAEIIDLLIDELPDSPLDSLHFENMTLDIEDLMELYSTTRDQLKSIRLKNCVIDTDTQEYAEEVLEALKDGLEATSFVNISLRADDDGLTSLYAPSTAAAAQL